MDKLIPVSSVVDDASRNAALRYLEQAERAAADVKGVPPDTALRRVERVGVVGCGTMGRSIAMALANGGYAVRILDVEEAAVTAALLSIRASYERNVTRGRLSAGEAAARVAAITSVPSIDGLADADLAIEAVFESLSLKSEVFRQLDRVCRPGAILASNTSNLDIDVLANLTSRPGDFVGAHFFAPAHVMRLLEIVRGRATKPDTLATTMALAHRLGKVGVVVGVCFGFVGNRMAAAYGEECARLLYAGASPWQIDRALESFGFAMGPFAASDLSGLDVDWRARRERTLSAEQRFLASIDDALYQRGRYGQKCGAGFYRYAAADGHMRQPDPDVAALVREIATAGGIMQREIADAEIINRCLLQLINVGAQILDDGIAARASDIDAVFVNGFGFPRERGGPMYIAEQAGPAAIVQMMDAFRSRAGPEWTAAQLIRRAAENHCSLANALEIQR